MKRRRLLAIGLTCLVLATADRAALAGPPGPPAAEPRMAGAYRLERDGWVYVHLEGSPERIGYQHGVLLAPEIGDLLRVIKPFLEHSTHRDWAFYREASEKMLWPGIDPEYRREIDGIVAGLASKGVSADRWDIVALNANQELPFYYVPWLDRREGKTPTTHAPGNCSALHRHGQLYPGRPDRHRAQCLDELRRRHAVEHHVRHQAGVRLADADGRPAGRDRQRRRLRRHVGRNGHHRDHHHAVRGLGPEGKARVRPCPQGHAVRSLDRRVRPIMLDGNNGGYANDWLVGDIKTGEIALFELGLKNHTVQRTQGRLLLRRQLPGISQAPARGDPVRPAMTRHPRPTPAGPAGSSSSPSTRGRSTSTWASQFETDDFDVISHRREANERTLCGRVEVSPRGVPRVGLDALLSRRHRPVEGHRPPRSPIGWRCGRQVGHHGSDFLAEPLPRTTPRVRLDARAAQGHEVRSVVALRGRHGPGRPDRRSLSEAVSTGDFEPSAPAAWTRARRSSGP